MTDETTEIHHNDETRAPGLTRNEDSGPSRVGAVAANEDETKSETKPLLEAMLDASNLRTAYRRVVSNGGAPGVDNVSVTELNATLKIHWPRIKEELLSQRYRPQPVRAVSIPKANGGTRTLGIPTVLDRFIQQALLQVVQPLFDPTFSESSYGFRPNRNAWQAVQAAQRHIHSGKTWVVDIDLEKFFDTVHHDILMSRIARKIDDKRVLKLIGRYLRAGIMKDGIESIPERGTPQGGPLSPLLSNILLDELDKELEHRGHAFCRYADDCNIYVGSETAGQRVLTSVTRYVENRLKLKVNAQKSAVAKPNERKFLGYSFTAHQKAKITIAGKSLDRLKDRIRDIFRGSRGRSLRHTIGQLNPLLRGWMSYFRQTEVKGMLEGLDGWLRRKLRVVLWRQAKRPSTRYRLLRRAGLDEQRARLSASNGRGPWWNAGASHMNAAFAKRYFDKLGLVSLQQTLFRFQRRL